MISLLEGVDHGSDAQHIATTRVHDDSATNQSESSHHERIAVAAYYLAARRSFSPGNEAADWLVGEAQIAAEDRLRVERD
jgi:hypothetical protein